MPPKRKPTRVRVKHDADTKRVHAPDPLNQRLAMSSLLSPIDDDSLMHVFKFCDTKTLRNCRLVSLHWLESATPFVRFNINPARESHIMSPLTSSNVRRLKLSVTLDDLVVFPPDPLQCYSLSELLALRGINASTLEEIVIKNAGFYMLDLNALQSIVRLSFPNTTAFGRFPSLTTLRELRLVNNSDFVIPSMPNLERLIITILDITPRHFGCTLEEQPALYVLEILASNGIRRASTSVISPAQRSVKRVNLSCVYIVDVPDHLAPNAEAVIMRCGCEDCQSSVSNFGKVTFVAFGCCNLWPAKLRAESIPEATRDRIQRLVVSNREMGLRSIGLFNNLRSLCAYFGPDIDRLSYSAISSLPKLRELSLGGDFNEHWAAAAIRECYPLEVVRLMSSVIIEPIIKAFRNVHTLVCAAQSARIPIGFSFDMAPSLRTVAFNGSYVGFWHHAVTSRNITTVVLYEVEWDLAPIPPYSAVTHVIEYCDKSTRDGPLRNPYLLGIKAYERRVMPRLQDIFCPEWPLVWERYLLEEEKEGNLFLV